MDTVGDSSKEVAGAQRGELLREKEKLFAKFLFSLPEFEKLRPTSRSILRREPLITVDSASLSRCLNEFSACWMSIPIP
jgi:hypothetical protein